MKSYLLLLSIFLFACKKEKTNYNLKNDMAFAKAESMFDAGNDSAFYYFNQVVAKQTNDLETARALCYMSLIQFDHGDFFGSQESATRALKLLKENNKSHQSVIGSCYNQLGRTSIKLKQYALAISYFNKAISFFDDKNDTLIAQNNEALAYQKLSEYAQSLKIYNQILAQKITRVEYARFLSNRAKTMWLANSQYNAAPELLKALSMRKAEKDDWGLNASYAHLADFYARKNPDSALTYAISMYQIAKKINSADDQLEALQKLITLSPSTATKKYFDVYQRLNDSVQTARNAAKNQFAIVRYESEKSKADNLVLQNQLIKREVLLASGFLLFIAASIIAFFWYKKRQQKMELEKQQAIQQNQLKTSKKVHDVVANGLYRVMSEMENQPDIDRELIIDRIEDLYEKSRDISYDKPELNKHQFNEKISALLTSFATLSTKIIIVGNNAPMWEKVSLNTQYELEHILQELMVNMKKHSQADTVVIKFVQEKNSISIFYTDNGVGMAESKNFNNGLNNTVSRIDAIGGTVTFETKLEKGLKIYISVPVS